jgi:hypothetical protein
LLLIQLELKSDVYKMGFNLRWKPGKNKMSELDNEWPWGYLILELERVLVHMYQLIYHK